MALTLWHNPRCSKSRAALALLTERGVEVTLRLYLKDTPSAAEITALATRIGVPLAALIRAGDARKLALDLDGLGESELAARVAAHPILLERPILDDGTRAVVGRPPETVLTLL